MDAMDARPCAALPPTDACLYWCAQGVTQISPWHDLELYPQGAASGVVNFVCEIPKGVTGKLEVQKKVPHNPSTACTRSEPVR
jgi:hypothetical protein